MDIQIITPPTANLTNALEHGLVTLTEAICQATGEESGFGLGGRYGYGENYENDVFVMRRFYWGECDCGAEEREDDWSSKNFHSSSCYYRKLQEAKKSAELSYVDCDKNNFIFEEKERPYEERKRLEKEIYSRLLAEFGLPEYGCARHCTCGHDKLFAAWVEINGHRDSCSLELPNFKHKKSGLEVRWYKWIGRDTEVKNSESVDLQAMFSDCMASLPTAPAPAGNETSAIRNMEE